MAKRIDVGKPQEAEVGTLYPPPFDEPCRGRGAAARRTRPG